MFDVKPNKFDVSAKIKIIQEVRAFTNMSLNEANDLVEKAPVVVAKEEVDSVMEKRRQWLLLRDWFSSFFVISV